MSKLRKSITLLAALACLGAALALVLYAGLPDRADYSGFLSDQEVFVAPEVGSIAPPFELWTPQYEPLTLEHVHAEFTIINFWATWCQPCQREMRELQRLYESETAALRILAVNLGESTDIVRNWIDKLGLSYDILLDPLGAVSQRYQVRGQPTTYLLDAGHRIQQVYYGPASYEQLLHDITRLAQGA